MKKTIINDRKILFNRWYRKPLIELENEKMIPNKDGGFVVLAVSCLLYEGYVTKFLNKTSHRTKYRIPDTSMRGRLSIDFNTDKNTAKIFWNVIRNGLLHCGTPKQKEPNGTELPVWQIYDEDIPFKLSDDSKKVYVNIWKIRDRVFELYDNNPDLISYHDDYPWGQIWYQP